jgi:hypothetical protein
LGAVLFFVHIFFESVQTIRHETKGCIIAVKRKMFPTYFHTWPLHSSSICSRIQFYAFFFFYSFLTHLPHIPFLLRFCGVLFLGFLSTLPVYSTFLLFCLVIPPPLLSTLPLKVFSYVLLANGRPSKTGDSAPKERVFSTAWNSAFVLKLLLEFSTNIIPTRPTGFLFGKIRLDVLKKNFWKPTLVYIKIYLYYTLKNSIFSYYLVEIAVNIWSLDRVTTVHLNSQALRIPEFWSFQISRQSAHEGGKVVSLVHRPHLPQEIFYTKYFIIFRSSRAKYFEV